MDYREIVEATRKELLKKLLLTEEEADRLSKEIVKSIQKELKPDLSNLDQLIDQYLEDYANSLADRLFNSIKEAAAIGMIPQTFEPIKSSAVSKDNFASKVAEELINHRYPDGLNLSERVWRWKKELKEGLKKTLLNQAKIRNSAQQIAYELQYTIEQIEKGKFTITMAEEQLPEIVRKLKQTALLSASNGGDLKEWRKVVKQVEKYMEKLTDNIQYGLKPSYKKLIKDLEKAIIERSEKAINEAIKWWIYDKQLYRLKVISRTEMSNAYHLSVIMSAEKNPHIVGFRWTLSKTHKIRDICDDLAHKDHYGLGPGVFPKDKVPLIQCQASHPQCLCRIVPVTATEVKGMDRVKRTQIQVRTILKDYHSMFSNVRDDRELVETFKSLFTSPRNYWKHVLKHAVPDKVREKYNLNNWIRTSRFSQKLFPYQKSYALSFLETLAYPEKIALVQSPKSAFDRIVLYSTKRRMAVILGPTGEVASVYELNRFKNWGEWKNYSLSEGEVVLEVTIDEETKQMAGRIQRLHRRLVQGSGK